MVIAGTGDDQAVLEATKDSLGLVDRVRFVGRVEGNDKIYLLQNAIATVMPSRVWEAFPLVVLETFAAGRAIMGTRVPGIADLIEDASTGFLFEDEDSEGLAQILRKTFAQPDQLIQIGAAARQVAERYSWASVAAMHIELYRGLLESVKKHGPDAKQN